MKPEMRGLVVFDLDGTLLRGFTVCELISIPLGQFDRMKQFEGLTSESDIVAAREEMAQWYRGIPLADLTAPLVSTVVAPGAYEAIALLRQNMITVAIASITWEFGVACFARRLQADYYIRTRLDADGKITHFWPRDKAIWIRKLGDSLQIPTSRIAGVGDSRGDIDMLRAVDSPIFVGQILPGELQGVKHLPNADILTVADWIMETWSLPA